ncbi:hypothetical protein J437_LFUL011385 [Ladona fulva]|uniref:MI domain-containing protein n=1 Tax=Ladona fulva TaxID=123851 RepID=A0A8K0KBC8_LADFU|nr:hypothetical protein J437_LFUL011385 [Ladona fulva]
MTLYTTQQVQYMIEVMFQMRKEFGKKEIIPTELDLVDENEVRTHVVTLEDAVDPQDILSSDIWIPVSLIFFILVYFVSHRFPATVELLIKRLVVQFRRSFRRNDKTTCINTTTFLAHLINMDVVHEILALEILTLLVENPTDHSIEVAISFLKECGPKIQEVSAAGLAAVFDSLRHILHEGQLDKRVSVGEIIDSTETNLVSLRRTIYLTITSSLDFEECAHKLSCLQLRPGQEPELCHMFLDCCSQQRTYEKFYGLLAQRFCQMRKVCVGAFEQIFKDSYETIHRLETNKLRNVAKFFAHLLFTDAISWDVLGIIKLDMEHTNPSSRIFVKILFQELSEYMGLQKLNERVKDPTLQTAFEGLFPRHDPKDTRFAINFFTSIGLGGLTDELRSHLKNQPKQTITEAPNLNSSSSDSSSSTSSSSSSSSESSSDSDSSSDSSSSASSSSDDSSDSEEKGKRKSSKKKATVKKKRKLSPKKSQKKSTSKPPKKRSTSRERKKEKLKKKR